MNRLFLLPVFFFLFSVSVAQVTHRDRPFVQEFAIKYDASTTLNAVASDRNGNIQLLSDGGLKKLTHGELLWPGKVVEDNTYRFMKDKSIVALTEVEDQFVYLDEKVIFSNAWAGHLYVDHKVENPIGFLGFSYSDFIVFNAHKLNFVRDGTVLWSISSNQPILEVVKSSHPTKFYVLTSTELLVGNLEKNKLESIFKAKGFVSVTEHQGNVVIAHEQDGLYFLDHEYNLLKKNQKLPSLQLNVIRSFGENLWVGSDEGAFKINTKDQIKYYASRRWLNEDKVLDIRLGRDGDILILNSGGLSRIVSQYITLAEKADFYRKQVRSRHIRNGFNATLSGMRNGDISTGYMRDSDNDGLWTSMYLAAEAFRYAVTKDPDALANTQESLDAMERLYTINPVKGFAARSFERTGHIPELADPDRWQKSVYEDWDWKATTSSDEAIGHIFAFGVIAEIIEEDHVKKQAIRLIDSMMTHIIENDFYLVDFDGKPTQWGRWNPEYVNAFSKNVGDRKLNSSNIIGMLQTAYHFTQKEVFKTKAFELMGKHGYLENLMHPMAEIGKADNQDDDLSRLLSVYWNHSDDEMYFLGYWGLYRYAFNDELREKYKEAILDHWEIELKEKDAVWNIMTAITGVHDCGVEDAVWFLQKYPMDLIQWTVKNSHRQDITLLDENFRQQSTTEVLPPDELKISRHNANRFTLDGGNDGTGENSAGDIWLLPYWMGRYLQIIY